ncbi:hypothetical protein [Tahibacter sp.]|uniref:hypothetical protein n=1 Tax=Tahibacter sp. TaxID=2056211 RepID=UPI0028C4D42E|nr:hypothetical protein [Tahibacter sp.]
MSGAGEASMLEFCLANGRIDAVAKALVKDAYAGSRSGTGTTSESNAPLRAHSTPDREDENVDPGHMNDPLEPRKGHRPKANEPLPVDAPPVPKLRPLE